MQGKTRNLGKVVWNVAIAIATQTRASITIDANQQGKIHMRRYCLLLSVILFVSFFGQAAQPSDLKATVILISIDGFRPDYIERTASPALHILVKEGVQAKALISSFPSMTFSNHYTIVTGLYPEHHGIISNTFYDPDFNATYRMSGPTSRESRWWGGEPIWVTAELQGRISASFFWVGSETEIRGKRPTYWKNYDGKIPNSDRVDTVLSWIDLPVEKRPSLITLYFSLIDEVGHDYGPDSPKTLHAVEQIDSVLGRLIRGLRKRNIYDVVDVVLVSDHGMSQQSPDRVIYLEDYIDSTDARVVDWSPNLAIIPSSGKEEKVYNALKNAHEHLKLYRKEEIPDRFHYRNNRRITPLLGVADDGWKIVRNRTQGGSRRFSYGGHGYDPMLNSMHALFLARGPHFKSGFTAEQFENIHVYSILCRILSLKPASNDGDWEKVRGLFK